MNVTVPEPVPLDPPDSVRKDALLTSDQPQNDGSVIRKDAVPPARGKVSAFEPSRVAQTLVPHPMSASTPSATGPIE